MIGERVHQFRRLRGLTVEALGKASGLSKGFISQVERGHSQPSLQSLARLASALGVPPTSLLAAPEPARATEDRLPRVERASSEGAGESALAAISEIAGAVVCRVSLAPGALLSLRAATPQIAAAGLAAVSAGEVDFQQAGEESSAAAGDCLVFDAAAPYQFANTSPGAALLVLVLSSQLALPIITEPLSRTLSEGVSQTASRVEGPLRLAAMRARHRALKGT
jgi:transcriptional regulator with XRE-family HTH domain